MLKISNDEFKLLANYIKKHSGIHLKDEKKALLVGRLSNYVVNNGYSSFMEYYNQLVNDTEGKELSVLIDRITTNHTYFMRESDHFAYLSKEVMPYLKQTVKNKDLRIWCAASSTGEEPYTLAILLHDYFGSEARLWNMKLLATDLSIGVLEKAKAGIYEKERLQSLPKIWLLNYFDKLSPNEYQVKQFLRHEVIYRRFNLLEPVYPFKKKFHVIFCRNVLIYFDADTKAQVIQKMYDALEYGGYLFIGHSETIDRSRSKFKYIKPAVYRKM